VLQLTRLGWSRLIAVVLFLTGCTAHQSTPRLSNPNRYIYVTSASLPGQCYRELGTIGFDEPFAAATIDEHGSATASRLRTLAVAKYPNNVDAIINVRPEQNDAGTAVTVTGDAVEIVDHPTVMCALRDLPPIIDSGAAAANAGIIGTIAGGLISGSPTAAMGAGTAGAAAIGTREVIAHQQSEAAQRAQLYRELLDQQREIRELLAERVRLNTCEEQELSSTNCEADSANESNDKTRVSTTTDYQDLPLFELQKQSAENQDYITKLKRQVADMKWQLEHRSMQ
jgi:hypothetical protein